MKVVGRLTEGTSKLRHFGSVVSLSDASSTGQLLGALSRKLARRAEFHDRSNFHLDAVFQSRAMLGNFDRLPFICDMKEKIAIDRFLGFDEGTVDHGVPLLS